MGWDRLPTGTTCEIPNRRCSRPPKMMPDPPYLIFNWLVLLCIDSYDSEQRRILQHYFFEIYKICTLLATLFLQFFDNCFSIFRQILMIFLLKNAFFKAEN